jgi:hypothetical protein
MDDLFMKFNAAIFENNLNVEILLDGEGDPGSASCLTQRWRPWNSGFITLQEDTGAFYYDNKSLGWDRLQVLNEDVNWWNYAVQRKFGKFVNSSYSYLLWEPSDQPSILSFADMYIDFGLLHAPGMRFAINMDPAQFETYVGSRTGRAWDTALLTPDTTFTELAYHTQSEEEGAAPSLAVTVLPSDLAASVGVSTVGVQVWSTTSAFQSTVKSFEYSLFGFNSTGDPISALGMCLKGQIRSWYLHLSAFEESVRAIHTYIPLIPSLDQ